VQVTEPPLGAAAGKDHAAVFAFDKPIGFDGGTLLTVELKCEAKQHGIARLRLFASTHADVTDPAEQSLLSGPTSQPSPDSRLGLAFFLTDVGVHVLHDLIA
jgi:hypothetical protein